MSTIPLHEPALVAGPALYARGADAESVRLGLVAVTPEGATAPLLEADGAEPVALALRARLFGYAVWGAEFALPVGPDVGYRLDGRRFPVVTELGGDVAIGFVSCNGQENGDEDRSHEDRDVMWRRLLAEHRARPFALLLHGGDQLYADEVVEAHPQTRRWAALPIAEKPGIAFDAQMEEAVRGYFFRRYLALMRQPAFAALAGSVPSMMIWDDHDIFDGWGSHPAGLQESPVALGLFRAAREMFVLFQLGADPATLPATCRDRAGTSFSQDARFPGFCVLLPDLRSERTPQRVMGERGWEAFEAGLMGAPEGDRRIVVSSVPALGPRLSLVEALLDLYPGQQQYEDDLRDQWQSRGHRAEWVRFLSVLEAEAVRRGGPVTVVSGEIHLATRGEMRLSNGTAMHQLVASGITHPKPPAALGLGLGLLSRLGHSPLPGRPIRLKRLPGQGRVYTAERNYLVLHRRAGHWTAAWELEESGRTAELGL